MRQFINGGFETTLSPINHGMWTLIRMPDVAAKLHADDSLIKPLVEGVPRWKSPWQFLIRKITKDVKIGGTIDTHCLSRSVASNVTNID